MLHLLCLNSGTVDPLYGWLEFDTHMFDRRKALASFPVATIRVNAFARPLTL